MSRICFSTFLVLSLPASSYALAAGAAAAPAAGSTFSFNPVLLGLVSLLLVMILVNGLLANVLLQLALACRDRFGKRPGSGPAAKGTLLLAALIFTAVRSSAEEAAAPVSPYISGIPRTEFYFLAGMIGFMLLVTLILLLLIRMLVRELRQIPARAHIPRLVFKRNFLDVFNRSVAVSQEASIVLDHNYDGIRELDNELPPWWKWGFVLTIVVSCIYMGYYHAAGGPSQIDEYNAAVAKGEEEKAAYLARSANNVDEHNVTMVLDAAELATAQNTFQNTCGACHAKDGGGNVGPNLTDDYWLHGGSIAEVFKSIKYGWPDKGMKSWKDDYSPRQIAALASYVKSLRGTKPLTPKAPQGARFVEGGDRALDSIGSKTDPSLAPGGKKENKDNPIGPYPAGGK